jgi:hypothetical protein
MVIWLSVLGLLAAALIYAWAAKKEQEDRALQLAFLQALAEARAKLSPEDMAMLEKQLEDLAALTHEAHRNGVPAKQATRMGKRAAFQQLVSAIEINRMFSADRKVA